MKVIADSIANKTDIERVLEIIDGIYEDGDSRGYEMALVTPSHQ